MTQDEMDHPVKEESQLKNFDREEESREDPVEKLVSLMNWSLSPGYFNELVSES